MEDENSHNSSLILLGRSFLRITKTEIDVHTRALTMKFNGEIVDFNIFNVIDHLKYIFWGNNETLLVIIVKKLDRCAG
ncbi:hypothetical protein NC653_022301 [Populus alba x Populus x berolinensis]|uniref:Uncharacterized protein n=1 Tax=Populus alba x Populus x berolinensis TaxID=444605 RepID=A0AAD6Q9J6_9ROSI|nr:hypothetical protein NC653_022301 [Populus alba x Populus x berolinensis]